MDTSRKSQRVERKMAKHAIVVLRYWVQSNLFSNIGLCCVIVLLLMNLSKMSEIQRERAGISFRAAAAQPQSEADTVSKLSFMMRRLRAVEDSVYKQSFKDKELSATIASLELAMGKVQANNKIGSSDVEKVKKRMRTLESFMGKVPTLIEQVNTERKISFRSLSDKMEGLRMNMRVHEAGTVPVLLAKDKGDPHRSLPLRGPEQEDDEESNSAAVAPRANLNP